MGQAGRLLEAPPQTCHRLRPTRQHRRVPLIDACEEQMANSSTQALANPDLVCGRDMAGRFQGGGELNIEYAPVPHQAHDLDCCSRISP